MVEPGGSDWRVMNLITQYYSLAKDRCVWGGESIHTRACVGLGGVHGGRHLPARCHISAAL